MPRSHTRLLNYSLLFLAILGCSGGEEAKRKELLSSFQMKEIVIGFHVYATKHRAEWPDSIDEIKPYLGDENFAKFMKNPLTGDSPGYEYVKPNIDLPEPQFQKTAVLYQLRNGKRAEDLPVGFADGGIQRKP